MRIMSSSISSSRSGLWRRFAGTSSRRRDRADGARRDWPMRSIPTIPGARRCSRKPGVRPQGLARARRAAGEIRPSTPWWSAIPMSSSCRPNGSRRRLACPSFSSRCPGPVPRSTSSSSTGSCATGHGPPRAGPRRRRDLVYGGPGPCQRAAVSVLALQLDPAHLRGGPHAPRRPRGVAAAARLRLRERPERARPDGYWDYEAEHPDLARGTLRARLDDRSGEGAPSNGTGRFPGAEALRDLAATLPAAIALVIVFPPNYVAFQPPPRNAGRRRRRGLQVALPRRRGVACSREP